MPISAILFGGRRASVVPLVFQSHDWERGVLGSIMASETTAAQAGAVGNLRRDPFAMLPFCGYNMADYFAHWLQIGAEAPDRDALPKIFYVNWFRKDADGKFLWPGYGENSRVLVESQPRAGQGAGGRHADRRRSTADAIDTTGLDVSREQMEELLRVDTEGWRAEVPLIKEYYAQFGDRLPQALAEQAETLGERAGLSGAVNSPVSPTSPRLRKSRRTAHGHVHGRAAPSRRTNRRARRARPWWRRPAGA